MRRAFLILVAAGVLVGGIAARAEAGEEQGAGGEQATGLHGYTATRAGQGTGLRGDEATTEAQATGLRGDGACRAEVRSAKAGDDAAGEGLAAPKHDVRRRATGEGQAQAQPQPARPAVRRPGPRRGFGVFATFEQVSLDAKGTFDAVLGKSRLTSFGASVEATNIVSRVFARVAFSRASADGERVFIIDGERIPLGIPLQVEMTPIEVAGGWRQPIGRRGRVAGYGGAGVLLLGYRETSEFGTPADDSDERFTGYLVFGGVDVDLFKGLTAGFEAQYRSVADAIGTGGVSQVFGETNLGGVVVRVIVGFRR